MLAFLPGIYIYIYSSYSVSGGGGGGCENVTKGPEGEGSLKRLNIWWRH